MYIHQRLKISAIGCNDIPIDYGLQIENTVTLVAVITVYIGSVKRQDNRHEIFGIFHCLSFRIEVLFTYKIVPSLTRSVFSRFDAISGDTTYMVIYSDLVCYYYYCIHSLKVTVYIT